MHEKRFFYPECYVNISHGLAVTISSATKSRCTIVSKPWKLEEKLIYSFYYNDIECKMYLFNSIMSHGCIPESFLFATILKLPKNSRLDLKNSNNYRAISLSSVFGKVFDKIII